MSSNSGVAFAETYQLQLVPSSNTSVTKLWRCVCDPIRLGGLGRRNDDVIELPRAVRGPVLAYPVKARNPRPTDRKAREAAAVERTD